MVSRTWGLHAGGDVPVDAADVVAGLVEAGLARLGAVAGHEAAVVAVQEPVEAAGDGRARAGAGPVEGADVDVAWSVGGGTGASGPAGGHRG